MLTIPQLNQQLKIYLEAIAQERPNRPQWLELPEAYTSTWMQLRAEAKRPASQKSNHVDQAIVPDDSKKTRTEHEVQEGLWRYAVEGTEEKNGKREPGDVLLIGKPGSGKSTSLQQLFLAAAKRALNELETNQPRIPVLMPLRYVALKADATPSEML